MTDTSAQTTVQAALVDGDGHLIHGVALGPDELTTGLYGKKRWPEEELESAALTLAGNPLTVDPEHASEAGLEVETNHGGGITIGDITRSAYEPGVGVLYEARVTDDDVAAALATGRLEVSIEAGNATSVDEDTETGAAILRDFEFTGMQVVSQGASANNYSAAGSASENPGIAALSAGAIGDKLDAADEGGDTTDASDADTAAESSGTDAADQSADDAAASDESTDADTDADEQDGAEPADADSGATATDEPPAGDDPDTTPTGTDSGADDGVSTPDDAASDTRADATSTDPTETTDSAMSSTDTPEGDDPSTTDAQPGDEFDLDGKVVLSEERHDELKTKAALADDLDEEVTALRSDLEDKDDTIDHVRDIYIAALADHGPFSEDFYSDKDVEGLDAALGEVLDVEEDEAALEAHVDEQTKAPTPQTGDESAGESESDETEAALSDEVAALTEKRDAADEAGMDGMVKHYDSKIAALKEGDD